MTIPTRVKCPQCGEVRGEEFAPVVEALCRKCTGTVGNINVTIHVRTNAVSPDHINQMVARHMRTLRRGLL